MRHRREWNSGQDSCDIRTGATKNHRSCVARQVELKLLAFIYTLFVLREANNDFVTIDRQKHEHYCRLVCFRYRQKVVARQKISEKCTLS